MAKSAAERQKAYRERRANEAGEQRINTWVNGRAHKALSSLAIRYGVTQKVMLERLIMNADDGRIVTKPVKPKSKPAPITKGKAPENKTKPPRKAVAKNKVGKPKRIQAPVTPSQATLWDEPLLIETPVAAKKARPPRGKANAKQ